MEPPNWPSGPRRDALARPGHKRILAAGTWKSRQISPQENCEAVRIGLHRRATRACIQTNEYQRHLASRDSRLAAASSILRPSRDSKLPHRSLSAALWAGGSCLVVPLEQG